MAAGNPLISLLDECVVRVERDGKFAGTGFFVAPGEVLTCAHVVGGATAITVSRKAWMSPAEIVSTAPPLVNGASPKGFPMPDIALLGVRDLPEGQPIVRLSTEVPAGGLEADRLKLSGFSPGTHRPGVIESNGTVVEFEAVFGDFGFYKLRKGQVVEGFSGCPVLNVRTGLVCAMVESTRGELGDLGAFAVPISVVADEFEGLLERNQAAGASGKWDGAVRGEREAAASRRGEAGQLPILPPPYDLDQAGEHAPSELLKPRYRIVPLLEREELEAELVAWRESGERLDILLLSGGGGAGKTRLALEACARAEQADWTAGLLTLDASANVDGELDRLVDWPGRLFVAIDYAETRPDAVEALIRRLAQRPDGPPARLVLVCRQSGSAEEIEELFARGDERESVAVALRKAKSIRLGDEEHALDRQRLFEAGVTSFHRWLGADGTAAAPTAPALQQAHFAKPLFVLAAALLWAENPSIDVGALSRHELMLDLVDRHEAQYWQRWNENLGTGLDRALQAQAVAVATLLGADTEAEALALVSAIPHLEDAASERRLEIARWLSHLYAGGQLERAPAIEPIEPDMLGEALVGRECAKRPALIDAALEVASDAQLARALTVLTRACDGNAELAQRVGDSLGQRLPGLVQRVISSASNRGELAAALELAVLGSRPTANVTESALEAGDAGPATAGLAAALYQVAIDDRRGGADGEPAALDQLAGLLTGSSGALANSNRGDQALEAAEEAVTIREGLVDNHPGEFQLSLAGSRSNLARVLVQQSECEEALTPIKKAVDAYRGLARKNRGRYLPPLSISLITFSNALSGLEREGEALLAIEEAVDGFREFVFEEDRERYLPAYVKALNDMVDVLPRDRWKDEALPMVEEAVKLSEDLFALDRRGNADALASSLGHLSLVLSGVGEQKRQLWSIEEAVELLRGLVGEGTDFYLADLADALNELAVLLDIAGRGEKALAVIEEAVALQRALAEDEPDDYALQLSIALESMTTIMQRQGRSDRALAVIEREIERSRGAEAAGIALLSRARWHRGENDPDQAVADALLALGGAEGGDDGLVPSEVRFFLGHFRKKSPEIVDSAWRRVTGEGPPEWLTNWSMSGDNWGQILGEPEGGGQRHYELLNEWNQREGEEAFEFMERNFAELSDPWIAGKLHEVALQDPEDTAGFSRLGLLGLAGAVGPAAVAEEVEERSECGISDSQCLEGDDPTELAMARLWSSSNPSHSGAQFQ
ncbi:MAG: trypsin-like peptidase domain-containing protein, partial [Solirubrobacterales bacterium]